MPRFFVSESQINRGENTEIKITGEDASHISRSLRMKTGDSISVCDMAGIEYNCVISSIDADTVTAVVSSSGHSQNEPPYKVVVYQSLCKGDKFDTVVQKAVELGAFSIVPVLTSRSTVRLKKEECMKKIVRWQRIAEAAAKQCGRGLIPEVREMLDFREAADAASCSDISLFCYEGERDVRLPDVLGKQPVPSEISVFIGPEGGFSINEAEYAVKAGMTAVSFGKRILRTESASGFVLSCISYEYE